MDWTQQIKKLPIWGVFLKKKEEGRVKKIKIVALLLVLIGTSMCVFSDDIQSSTANQPSAIESSGASVVKAPIKKTHKKKISVSPSGSSVVDSYSNEDDYTKFTNSHYVAIDEDQTYGDSSTIITGDDNFSMTFNQFSGGKIQKFSLKNGDEIIFYTDSKIKSGNLLIGFVNLDTDKKLGDVPINKKAFTPFYISEDGNYGYVVVGENVQGVPAHINVKWKIIPNASALKNN